MTIISPSISTVVAPTATVRAHHKDLRAVPAALRGEWIKLSTLRSNKVTLAVAAALGAIVAWALAASSTDASLTASELFIYPLPLVATLAIVTGILMFTAEAQHGTLAVTLITRPARWVIVLAKTAMALVAGVALGAVAMGAGFGGAILGGADVG